MDKNADVRNLLVTPTEFTQLGSNMARHMQQNRHRAVKFPVASMQHYVAPLYPGEIMLVVAQPSNGKTTFMLNWEQKLMQELMQQGRDRDEVIVHWDLESTLNMLSIRLIAREVGTTYRAMMDGKFTHWGKVAEAVLKINRTPIIYVGQILPEEEGAHPGTANVARSITKFKHYTRWEELHLSTLEASLDLIRAGEVFADKRPRKIAAVFYDYIQATPWDPSFKNTRGGDEQTNAQISANFYRLRDIAGRFSTPVIVASQALYNLDESNSLSKNLPVPDVNAAKGTRDLAERTDRAIGIMLVKQFYPPGTTINEKGFKITSRENLCLIWVTKQRGDLPSRDLFGTLLDYQTGHYEGIDLR